MVKKNTRKSVPRKTRKNNNQASSLNRWFRKVFFISFGMLTFLMLVYLGYLDYTVRLQFEGKRWAIPARVYAGPVELYSGHNLSLEKYEDLLQQLHYRQDYQLSSAGSYYKKGPQITVKTRPFTFWDQQQASQLIRVSFKGNSVVRILALQRNAELPIIRMDPVQIGSFYPTRKEDRVLIKLQNTPETLIQGLLATEDRNFFNHFGLSPRAILRALWANIKAGGVVQGGSTITQQLVKNFYLTPERSLIRKINEALMALILEYRFSKEEILEAYLNEVYLGQDGASAIHGFGLASEYYFGRPLQNLPLQQVATLVALVRGPSYYDPRRKSKRALQRRNLVLDEMAGQGYISTQQMAQAKRSKLDVITNYHRSVNRYPGFLDLVRRQLRREYREQDLTSDGLKIFTTLDSRVQNFLEITAQKKLQELEKRPKVSGLETAAIVTRRDGGEIVALIGSRDRKQSGFNRALDAERPIGSLIKPVVYLSALEYPDRYTINTLVGDRAINIKGQHGKVWSPRNYDRKEHGDVPLHTALTHSYNLATVRIGMDVGIARTAKTLRNLGVTRPVNLYPSFLLGASPLSPLEVTQMYQTLAGDGFSTSLRAIRAVLSAENEILQRYPFTVRQTVDPEATYITNTILQEVMHEGTGRSAYLYLPETMDLVGKTGTTNALRDSWFAGYSGDYLSVFWVGRDDNKPAGLTGSSGALQLWTALMRKIARQPVVLMPPENIEMTWIDPENGFLANSSCYGAVEYPYISGSAPSIDSPCIATPVNRAREWFNQIIDVYAE